VVKISDSVVLVKVCVSKHCKHCEWTRKHRGDTEAACESHDTWLSAHRKLIITHHQYRRRWLLCSTRSLPLLHVAGAHPCGHPQPRRHAAICLVRDQPTCAVQLLGDCYTFIATSFAPSQQLQTVTASRASAQPCLEARGVPCIIHM